MAKTSGGIRGKGDSNGATEKGYTSKMRKNILAIESQYRRERDETLHVFSAKGTKITSIKGKGAGVEFSGKLPENSILTHNHPRSLGARGITRIGNSFSLNDIKTAINTNAKEIRAVTPTYTFSIKRPKGGWGVSSLEVAKRFDRIKTSVDKGFRSYFEKTGYTETSVARANVLFYHEINKRLAKHFGWDYTRKKG